MNETRYCICKITYVRDSFEETVEYEYDNLKDCLKKFSSICGTNKNFYSNHKENFLDK